MSDITINNDESQSKKQKMAPVEESLNMQNQADIVVENAILKIWRGNRGFYTSLIWRGWCWSLECTRVDHRWTRWYLGSYKTFLILDGNSRYIC